MKVHCYNILLFSFTLIILLLSSSQVNNQMNHYNRAHMKNIEPIKSYRSLCECELYTSMYDDDPEMKEILHDFDRQTSQRFEEYNERMNKNRQKCKEQCDRDIKNIILKDKIAKELKQELTTLETNIGTNDIPTCVCDKSVADKVEKTCLKCGGVLGGGVLPGWSVLGSIGFYTFVNSSAIKAATKGGIAKVLSELKEDYVLDLLFADKLASFVTTETYACPNALNQSIMVAKATICKATPQARPCSTLLFDPSKIGPKVHSATTKGIEVAKDAAANTWNSALSSPAFFSDPIVISAIVVICIALILLIIYLILRYHRKKKINKKLKYIKLLKE
ncbi:hypothetical protein PFAG_03106 [Plasmodium falciparum Santa Lucia]|uniref:Surface antigen n=1 Tax=Plasmodium falciparum Santa Lucia TaxID=478859 RepID=W7G4R7_PLAFA|nr:hypothetical protein PFAG_03106 [Plasmodium falciparum Santa Lucia]